MYILTSYGVAVLCCVVSMLAWGSWPNAQKLTRAWRFELFYWDFVAGILVFAGLWGLTAGSTGALGRPFLRDLAQATAGNVTSAVVGGVVWNLANLLLVAAIAFAGLAIAFSVGTGIGWIAGICINYYYAPVGNAVVLFAGAACIAFAISLSMVAYRRIPQDRAGAARTSTKGVLLAVVGGLLICWYYRFVASTVASSFVNPQPGRLTPYSAVFLFSVGVVASTFVFNTYLMRRPIAGSPWSWRDYSRGSAKNHLLGLLGGLVWCLALALSFLASDKAGFAISYGLGNGATMVGILWGVLFWKEFRLAPVGTGRLLVLMFLFYLVGLGLIVFARVA